MAARIQTTTLSTNRTRHRAFARALAFERLLGALLLAAITAPLCGAQIDIPAPAGSTYFGGTVRLLPNGNFVVVGSGVTPEYEGAVYLFDPSGKLISTLVGGSAFAFLGGGGVTVLSDGNFVVCSPAWREAGGPRVGAVTWVDGTVGLSGAVSPQNSLLGSTPDDSVCSGGVTALDGGRYVVASPLWDNGPVVNAGAVTWIGVRGARSGVVSRSNSLIGRAVDDRVGGWHTPIQSVRTLTNGHYVVVSPLWDNGPIRDVGAVTWVNGETGLAGEVTTENSLFGTSDFDVVGHDDLKSGISALPNGHFVVRSRYWNNGSSLDAGAATWGDGYRGITGPVSPTNSLVGTKSDDRVSVGGVIVLSQGNYVVVSPWWDQEERVDAGAVTWSDGSNGLSGSVAANNSMIGGRARDFIGSQHVVALTNGNYVVASPSWDSDEVPNVGAVTWADGSQPFVGTVNAGNSLVGTRNTDNVGSQGMAALANGNYVVVSARWANELGITVGAVTWGNGRTGTHGAVSSQNSLVGGPSPNSNLGHSGVRALVNGNYVVASPYWNEGVGAVTWGNGRSGITGLVTSSNSLIGAVAGDNVGLGGSASLNNGHYVSVSREWDNGNAMNAGAATWGDGATGTTTGVLSSSKSLVGTQSFDEVGRAGVTPFADSYYAVYSPQWDNGTTRDAGAVTLIAGGGPASTTINANNSVLGTMTGEGGWSIAYDTVRKQMIVGRPEALTVSLLTLLPNPLFENSFE